MQKRGAQRPEPDVTGQALEFGRIGQTLRWRFIGKILFQALRGADDPLSKGIGRAFGFSNYRMAEYFAGGNKQGGVGFVLFDDHGFAPWGCLCFGCGGSFFSNALKLTFNNESILEGCLQANFHFLRSYRQPGRSQADHSGGQGAY